MRPAPLLITAITLSITIRAILLVQAPGIGFEAYQTLLHATHIAETGFPLIETTTAWGEAHTQTAPLFYYLIAFATIFLTEQQAALWIPNILISLLPIPVYLLASQLTKNNKAIITATLASVFIPVLYPQTLLTASPLSLAIPLFFGAYYYFVRLAKTPRYQIHFITTTALLTLTHPIALLLVPAMAITILLTYVQRTRFSKTLTEAALFTTFLTVWANVIIYKTPLQWYGLRALNISPQPLLGIAETIVLVGMLPLIVGVLAAFSYLTEEKDTTAHALIALLAATIIGMLTTLLDPGLALAIASPTLLALTAGGIAKYAQAKRRARMPGMYTFMFTIGVAGFLITTAVPAIALGAESFREAPTDQDQEILAALPHSYTVLWDAQKGHYLQYHGITVPFDTHTTAHPDALRKTRQLQQALSQRTELRFIQALNEQEITVVVLPENHSLPLGERCFERLHKEHEVYQLRCVVH